MQSEGLDQLIANLHERVQTGHRVLKDHGDIAPTNGAQFSLRERQ